MLVAVRGAWRWTLDVQGLSDCELGDMADFVKELAARRLR
jgi:hypothetical protein